MIEIVRYLKKAAEIFGNISAVRSIGYRLVKSLSEVYFEVDGSVRAVYGNDIDAGWKV